MEYATGHYSDAYVSYKQALQLKPEDENILNAVSKAAKEILKENRGAYSREFF